MVYPHRLERVFGRVFERLFMQCNHVCRTGNMSSGPVSKATVHGHNASEMCQAFVQRPRYATLYDLIPRQMSGYPRPQPPISTSSESLGASRAAFKIIALSLSLLARRSAGVSIFWCLIEGVTCLPFQSI